MVQVSTLRRRSWAGMAWLCIVVAGLLLSLALGNIYVLLSTLAVAALAFLLVRGQAPTQASTPSETIQPARMPQQQRGVLAADGTARQALVVPAAAVDGYQTVLTIDGYALVNAEGRVVYALNRQSHDPASEPVVVTIFDAEAVASEA